MCRVEEDGDSQHTVRQYTPVSPLDSSDSFQIAIKVSYSSTSLSSRLSLCTRSTHNVIHVLFFARKRESLRPRLLQHCHKSTSSQHTVQIVQINCMYMYSFTGTVVYQLYADGRMSHHVRKWAVGSTALWRGPFGNLHYSPNKVRL